MLVLDRGKSIGIEAVSYVNFESYAEVGPRKEVKLSRKTVNPRKNIHRTASLAYCNIPRVAELSAIVRGKK